MGSGQVAGRPLHRGLGAEPSRGGDVGEGEEAAQGAGARSWYILKGSQVASEVRADLSAPSAGNPGGVASLTLPWRSPGFPRHPEALRGSLTTNKRKSFTQRGEYVTELVNPSPKMGQIFNYFKFRLMLNLREKLRQSQSLRGGGRKGQPVPQYLRPQKGLHGRRGGCGC